MKNCSLVGRGPSSYVDKKGYRHYIKPSCRIDGKAVVNVRAVNANTGIVSKVLTPSKGNVSSSFEVQYQSQCRVNSPVTIASQAVENSINNLRVELQNTFPFYGYLYKTMTDPTNSKIRIAYINLGKNDGVKGGDRVDLIKYVKETDRIKNVSKISTQEIAEVVISETDLREDSSIIIIPEEISSQVMPGLAVKTKGVASFFGNF